MRNRRFLLGASALVIALAISGCSHNLVADQGAKTVTVFMDEDVYKALLDTRQRIEDPNYNAGAKNICRSRWALRTGKEKLSTAVRRSRFFPLILLAPWSRWRKVPTSDTKASFRRRTCAEMRRQRRQLGAKPGYDDSGRV